MGTVTFNFKDRVALVTGAASGIGRQIATAFAESGARTVLSDVNEESGMQTLAYIKELGGDAIFHKCDVSQSQEVKSLVDKTIDRYGQLNLVCNNAGIEGTQGDTVHCPIDNWDKVVNINLKGLWLCMKYEIPEIIKSHGGALVNISSIAGLVGFAGLPAYVASKHGVVGLTQSAALEFAEKKVRINSICPGPIMTPMLERLMAAGNEFKEHLIVNVPQRRIGSSQEVASCVLFLCSDEASFITGQSLAIDGGWVSQ